MFYRKPFHAEMSIKYKKFFILTQDVMCVKKLIWLAVIVGMKHNFVGLCSGFKSSNLSNIYST